MRIDFSKIKKLNNTVPQELIDHYSKEVNKRYVSKGKLKDFNIEYEYDEESELIRNISPFKMNAKFKLPDNMPSEVQTYEDLVKYLYNSQTEIEFDKNDIPFIKLDGEEIPIDNLFLTKQGEPVTSMRMGISPIRFNPNDKLNFNLKVSSTVERNITLTRKSHNSITTKLYVNEEDSDLFIFSVKIKDKEIQFSVVSKLSKPAKINDILFVKKLLLSFQRQTLLVNGVSINTLFAKPDTNNDLDEKELSNDILMWENIKKLELILEEEFTIKMPLTNKEAQLINELLVSFILDKPFKDYVKVNSLNLDVKSVKELQRHEEKFTEIKDSQKSMFIGGQLEKDVELFDLNLKLVEIYQIYNVIVNDVKTNEKELKIELFLKESTKDHSHVSRKFSMEKEEIEDINNEFKKALYINEYKERILEMLKELN